MNPRPQASSSMTGPADAAIASMSINQITRAHCRERLLVAPIYWTGRHLELLRCSFACPQPAPPTSQADFSGERNGRRFIAAMIHHWSSIARDDAIEDLVSSDDCPLQRGERQLHFYFGRCVRVPLQCTPLCRRHGAETDASCPPIAAYVNRDRIRSMRCEALHPPPHWRRNNYVALEIYRHKLRTVMPPDPLYEPYIAAILIAIAQAQQAPTVQLKSRNGHASIFPARVLSSSSDKEYMHLYTADITSAFLDKLNDPSAPPVELASIRIEITTIPYKPYSSLRDRIFSLLHPKPIEIDGKRGRER